MASGGQRPEISGGRKPAMQGWSRPLRCALRRLAALATLAALGACAPLLARSPVPETMVGEALPLGLPGLRYWGDALSDAEIAQLTETHGRELRERLALLSEAGEPPTLAYLALSGGAQWGAFGAGVLKAWSESGTRPVFAGVSGISTGAIMAPFAFLGSEYDAALQELYSGYGTDDLLEPTILSGLISGTALTDTAPLARIIAEKVAPEFLAKIAEEYGKGRVLLVGTTNLDSGRPMIWNMGAIAASGHPDALELFRKVILASASVPVAFPPVLIPVIGPDGKTYDEMHVDGGATSQVTFISPSIPIKPLTEKALGRNVERHLYLIMNNDLLPPYAPVRPRILKVGGAAVSALIRGSGTGDLYKLYLIAERDDIDYSVGWIPPRVPCEPPAEAFDRVFMRCLFEVGEELFRSGELWRDLPPYFVLGPS